MSSIFVWDVASNNDDGSDCAFDCDSDSGPGSGSGSGSNCGFVVDDLMGDAAEGVDFEVPSTCCSASVVIEISFLQTFKPGAGKELLSFAGSVCFSKSTVFSPMIAFVSFMFCFMFVEL